MQLVTSKELSAYFKVLGFTHISSVYRHIKANESKFPKKVYPGAYFKVDIIEYIQAKLDELPSAEYVDSVGVSKMLGLKNINNIGRKIDALDFTVERKKVGKRMYYLKRDLVAAIVPAEQPTNTSLTERIAELKAQGMHMAAIVGELGISISAANKLIDDFEKGKVPKASKSAVSIDDFLKRKL